MEEQVEVPRAWWNLPSYREREQVTVQYVTEGSQAG